jgi:predicted MFS family arabinose efflux permease
MLTLTGGLTALVLALIEGNAWGWGSPEIVGLLAGSALSLIAFVVIELRRRVPMVDFSFFRSRTFAGANLVAVVISFAMLAQFFFMAMYMQNVLGYDALGAGIRFLPSTLFIIVLAPIAGRLADRIGPKPLIIAGLSLLALSLFLQAQISVDSGYAELLPAFMLLGAGIALTMSPMSTAAMNAVDVAKAGVASGVLSMGRMVGGTLGIAVTGALFQSHFSASDAQAGMLGLGSKAVFVDDLTESMTLSLGVVLLGMVFAAVLIRGRGIPPRARVQEAHPEAVAEPLGAQ